MRKRAKKSKVVRLHSRAHACFVWMDIPVNTYRSSKNCREYVFVTFDSSGKALKFVLGHEQTSSTGLTAYVSE